MKTASGANTDIRRSMLPFSQPFPNVSINVRPSTRVSAPCPSSVMPQNIYGLCRASVVFTALLLLPAFAQGQTPCPPAADSAVENGWLAYRANLIEDGVEWFN